MIEIKDNQSVFDIGLQYGGDMEAVFDWAVENGLSITDDLKAGDRYPEPKVVNKKRADEIANKGYIFATAVVMDEDEFLLQGIGYWAINIDFIVS